MSDILKEKLPEELYTQVKEHLGDAKFLLNDGSYIPKSRFDEVNTKKSALESQVNELTDSLTETKRNLENSGANQEIVDKLKADLEASKSEFEATLIKKDKDFKVELALRKLNPKNDKAVKALFDLDKVSVDGDNLIGFDDQAKVIVEENPFLFNDKTPPPKGGSQAPSGGDVRNPFNPEHRSYFEQIKLKKSNPDLYKQMENTAVKKGWI